MKKERNELQGGKEGKMNIWYLHHYATPYELPGLHRPFEFGEDLETKHNRNELVWRNDFAFVRKHLTQENFFVNGIFNDWSITDAGKKELFSLCNDVACVNNFKYISSVAREKAEELTK